MTEEDLETIPALRNTPTDTTIQPHDNTTTPTTISSQPTTKDERKEIAMIRAGVTDELVFKVAKDGLTAGKWENRYDAQGNCNNVWVPDLMIQHKYFDSILRVKGYIRPDAVVDNSLTITVTQRTELKKRIISGYAKHGKVIDI